jgi:SAM-dependent methyltransferase
VTTVTTEAPPPQRHWDDVYHRVGPGRVSWFQPNAPVSLELITRAGSVGSVIDVGGGASVLVDRLLAAGMTDVTVLDVAASSLRAARDRLGPRGTAVGWVVHDVLSWPPPRRFDLWHDRAVFHFLTEPLDRAAYRAVLRAALHPGGHVVIGTFALDGPTRCSGLPVCRYDAQQLAAEFPGFQVVHSHREEHRTPAGALQPFSWLLLRDIQPQGQLGGG